MECRVPGLFSDWQNPDQSINQPIHTQSTSSTISAPASRTAARPEQQPLLSFAQSAHLTSHQRCCTSQCSATLSLLTAPVGSLPGRSSHGGYQQPTGRADAAAELIARHSGPAAVSGWLIANKRCFRLPIFVRASECACVVNWWLQRDLYLCGVTCNGESD